ncbi:hypothetical protein, partial [Escherichia coli]|uniref:hypothetical protein n=1 Tax=Escherichia coli TaxID=562 RepID=UPI001BFCA5E8
CFVFCYVGCVLCLFLLLLMLFLWCVLFVCFFLGDAATSRALDFINLSPVVDELNTKLPESGLSGRESETGCY